MYYSIPLTAKELSQRKLEEYEKFCTVIQAGRKNPVWFIENFFGVKLPDYQKWCLMQSWTKPFVMWLCCRGAGKTVLAAIYYQAKLLLIPDYQVYISTLTLAQSIETFKKLEDLALQKIPSFKTCTDLFAQEVERGLNSETGFSHNPSGHKFNLYNNSGMLTLSSNLDALRGKRGSVMYDETAWQTAEQMAITENFINVDSSFRLGVGTDSNLEPIQVPLQLLYASSAGDVTYPFYEKYKSFSKQMFMGNPNYFVCDLNAETIMGLYTVDGILKPSHLTKEQIEKSIKEDPEAAERELFNRFRKGAGENAVVKMETLIRNSKPYRPTFFNDTGKRKFIFCYDPARNFDGSILSVWEIVDDPKIGYRAVIVNCVSMVDIGTAKKTPLPMPEQIKIIKRMMIAYNGQRAADWENILAFYIDAGAGGGGKSAVADNLMEDWIGEDGHLHMGIIDPQHKQYETSRMKYDHARPIVRLLEPTSHKRQCYFALEEMTRLDLMTFPDYDGKGSIFIEREDGDFETFELSTEEDVALTQCNLMKNEISYMCRYETPNGGVQYELARDKKNTINDDRADSASFAAFGLSEIRRKDLTSIKEDFNLDLFQSTVTEMSFDTW